MTTIFLWGVVFGMNILLSIDSIRLGSYWIAGAQLIVVVCSGVNGILHQRIVTRDIERRLLS